jgi:tetrapyrrole methylase family protein/MazG family protein
VPEQLTIVGLGPSGPDHTGAAADRVLRDPAVTVVLRTLRHPAAADLAREREVIGCDDIYESASSFDDVYMAIAERVLGLPGHVVYAVPGSAVVGERTVPLVRHGAARIGCEVEMVPGTSFLDLVYERVGVDPLVSGVQIVDARELPDPLPHHLPTIVSQVDRPVVAADVAVALGKVLPDDFRVTMLRDLGGADENVAEIPLHDLATFDVDERTSVYVPAADVGWVGLVHTNRRLRRECPWDREQTHHSLVRHLIEEAYETVEALGRLPVGAPLGDVDYGAYAEVEEELGDLLLQVVFHATLAKEAAAFDVEEIAEGIRRKLVARHPHVFADVVAEDADAVRRNWERIKREEKPRDSALDGVPVALPALARAAEIQRRAAAVGFDWPDVEPVLAKVTEELEEVRATLDDGVGTADELGDLLFAVVNLARHLDTEPETVLRAAAERFDARFRQVEHLAGAGGRDMQSMALAELDELWEQAKRM